MGNPSFNDLKMDTISCLKDIYGMVPQPIMLDKNISNKIKNLLKSYEEAKKKLNGPKAKKFADNLDNLFDVSHCKCPMIPVFQRNIMTCKCPHEYHIHEKGIIFLNI